MTTATYNTLTKDEAVLLGLLSEMGRMTLRTKLVKMVYLLDNMYFEQLGRQLTSFRYHWDHYGPNALGNTITQLLDVLAQRELVKLIQKQTPYENYSNWYGIAENVNPARLPLSNEDWAFIYAIVRKFGPMSREQVVRASKATGPMQGIAQYDLLSFRPNEFVEAKKQRILADRGFMKATRASMRSDQTSTPIEGLRFHGQHVASARPG